MVRRAGKGGAGVACVSLEVLYERCAVHGTARRGWTPLRLPRTESGAATDRARGGNTGLADGGDRRVRAGLWCTAAGAGWRSVCSSYCAAAVRAPGPPEGVHAACADAKRGSSARIPKEHGCWGREGAAVADRWRRKKGTFEARCLGGREGGRKGGIADTEVLLLVWLELRSNPEVLQRRVCLFVRFIITP